MTMSTLSLPGRTELSGLRQRSGSIELMAGAAICTSRAQAHWGCTSIEKMRSGQEQIEELHECRAANGNSHCQLGFSLRQLPRLRETMRLASGFLMRTKDFTGGQTAVLQIIRESPCSKINRF